MEYIDHWNHNDYKNHDRAFCSIGYEESHLCSCIAIDPYYVITAAHCVLDEDDELKEELTVEFGRNVNNASIKNEVECSYWDYETNSYGPFEGKKCIMEIEVLQENDNVIYVEGYQGGPGKDFAVIRLPHSLERFNGIGFIAPDEWSSPQNYTYTHIFGYGNHDCPVNDPHGGSDDCIGKLHKGWHFYLTHANHPTHNLWFEIDGYRIDNGEMHETWACGGDSGGPVFNSDDELIGLASKHFHYPEVEERCVKVHKYRNFTTNKIENDKVIYDNFSVRDGYHSYDDNCPLVSNPAQKDHDQDGLGDACDLCSSLYVSNELPTGLNYSLCTKEASLDNCLDYKYEGMFQDIGQYFAGWDPSSFETAAGGPYGDYDNDGVPNACDNCWLKQNPQQEDMNGNSMTKTGPAFMQTGDACDPVPSLVLEELKDTIYRIFPCEKGAVMCVTTSD